MTLATKFERIVAAIKSQLDANVPGNTIAFTTGRLKLAENDAPNRVGWVRTGGRTTEVDAAGPAEHVSAATEDADPDDQETVASKAILTDSYDVEAYVWGADQDQADAIREAVIRAAHNVLSPRSADFARWQDLTENEQAAHEVVGAYHRLEFVFRVPILEDIEQPLALLLSEQTTAVYAPGPLTNPLDLQQRP